MANSIAAPAPLDVGAGNVPTPDQLAARRVSATVDGGSVTSNVDSAGSQSVFSNAAKTLGKQDFLNLLVTQLQHQDPMQPEDNTQFVSQLAQFSSLEGTSNINTSIEALGKQIESMVAGQKASSDTISNSSATSMIGKQVRVQAKAVQFDPANKEPIQINVHSDPGTGSVLTILDDKENIVNAVPIPSPGENLLQWDGTKMDGSKVPAGQYTLKVTTPDGKTDTGYAYLEDAVTGISYTKDGVRLEVRGQQVGMDQIMHVGAVTAATNNTAASGD